MPENTVDRLRTRECTQPKNTQCQYSQGYQSEPRGDGRKARFMFYSIARFDGP